MEVTDILEKYSDDDNDCDIPDNVIYVIFPENEPPVKVEQSSSKTCSVDLAKIKNSSELFSFVKKCDNLATSDQVELPDRYISNVDNFIIKDNKRDVAIQTDVIDDLSKLSDNDDLLEYVFYEEKEFEALNLLNLDISKEASLERSNSVNEVKSLIPRDDELKKEIEEESSVSEVLTNGEGISSHKSDESTLDRNSKSNTENSDANRRKRRQKIMTNLPSMKCKHCREEFSTFSGLQRHSKSVHDSTEFSFPCNLCGQSFTRPHNLLRHKDTRHREGEKKYVCQHCGRKFGRQDIFTSHLRLMHSSDENASRTKHLYQCKSCKKFFAKHHNYVKHREGNLSCSKCSLSFPCKRGYREHLNKKHSVTCDTCGKTCFSKQQMYAHKLTHTPKFNCEYCGKGFVWESSFVIHLATHTGIRPLNCEICGKSFAHTNAVKKHKWQDHTEANRKHRCHLCGKGFVYKAKLDTHVRIHSGKRPFPCQLCSSYFSQERNLIAHMKVIHGTLPDSVYEVKKTGKREADDETSVSIYKIKTGKPEADDETSVSIYKIKSLKRDIECDDKSSVTICESKRERESNNDDEPRSIEPINQLTVQELPANEIQPLNDVPIATLASEGLIIKGLDSNGPIYQIIYTYPSCVDQ